MQLFKRTSFQIILFCVLGSIVRLAYGIIYTPWELGPDHIAWEIIIQNGELSYTNLIYYPHEGGTFLISLFSHIVRIFTDFNSLVVSAFILDFLVRLTQIFIVHKVFGKQLMVIFGIWTIFALPFIIPWGTLNFGLHAISSIFPFLLLYFLWLNRDDKKYYILIGIFLGLAFWFSYSNMVLIAAFVIFQLFNRRAFKKWFFAIVSFSMVMLIHVLVRTYADPGFQLTNYDLSSIRGIEFSLDNIEIWKRIYNVWFDPLADSSVAILNSDYTIDSLKYVWLILFGVGLIGCLRGLYKNVYPKSTLICVLLVFIFLGVYAISPFYYENANYGHFINYRHLSYILPMLALLTFVGLSEVRLKIIWSVLFLSVGVYGSSILFFQEPFQGNVDKAGGWALTRKFGHNPENLYEIVMASNRNKDELVQGIGWGMSAALFSVKSINEPASREEGIVELLSLLDRYPTEAQDNLTIGVCFAFQEGVTPVLDRTILDEVLLRLKTPG